MRTLLLLTLMSPVALLGCGDDGSTGMGGAGGSGLTPFTEAEVQQVFTNSCAGAGCHVNFGANPAEGMSLESFATNGMVIGIASNQSDLDRIEPGSRQDSYLWHKINGSQATVGGSGQQMPQGRTPLGAETIERIGLYIDNLQ